MILQTDLNSHLEIWDSNVEMSSPPPVLFPFPSQLSTLMKSYIVVSGGRRKEKEKEKARKGGREKDWEGGS